MGRGGRPSTRSVRAACPTRRSSCPKSNRTAPAPSLPSCRCSEDHHLPSARYTCYPSSAGTSLCLYSPECVEGEFSEVELPIYGVLRSSALPWGSDVLCAMAHIHSPHTGVCCLRYVA